MKLQWHSLVTPGSHSQDEGEEEDGAHNGPDDDVGAGDTWDRETERGAESVLIGWGSVASRATPHTGGYINHKSPWQNVKHTTFSGKSVKEEQGRQKGRITQQLPSH